MASQANVKAVITAEDRASGVISGVGSSFGKMTGAMALGQLAAQAVTRAFDAMVSSVKKGLTVAADLETARVGFITLLGSAEKADAIMTRIKREAARTPFEIAGLTQSTQLLASVTKNGDKALDFILNIGQGLAAMGRGQAELDRISVNLQQIAANGRAFGIDIRQFAFAGIPIYEMLQEEIGKTGEELSKFIEDGGVTFDLLDRMFKKATDSGGRFHGAFANQAGTFNQLVSNMKDSFNIFLSDFVKQTGLFSFVKQSFGSLTTFLSQNSQSIINTFNNIFAVIAKVANYLNIPYKAAFDVIRNSWSIVQPALQQMWASIQTNLIPALQKLWEQLSPILTPALKEIGVVIGAVIIGAILALAKAIEIAALVVGKFIGYINQLITIAQPLIDTQMAIYNSIHRNIIQPTMVAVSWLLVLYNKFNEATQMVRNALKGIDSIIRAPFEAAFSFILGGINEVARALERLSGKSILDSTKKAVSNPLKFLTGNATGTDHFGGGMTWVGEQGKELVQLPRGSKVIPNNQTKNYSGGGASTVNITVQAGAYMGSQQDARRYAVMIADALKDVAAMQGQRVSDMLGA